jgi:hypothetical protein
LEIAAAFEGAAEGEFVGVIKAAAGGEALGDAGNADASVCESLGQIVTGGVAFDIGGEREDDLFDALLRDALRELGDAQVLGTDAVERGEFTAEDVKVAAEAAGLFDGENIYGFLDDAEQRGIAARVGADRAGLAFGEAAAVRAELNCAAGACQGFSKIAGEFGRRLNEVEGDAFGGTGADAGKFSERGDQRL